MRGQYLVTPSSDVSVLFIGDFSRRNEVCCQATPVYPGPFAGIITALASNPLLGGTAGQVSFPDTPTNPFNRQSFANYPIAQQIWDRGFSGQVDWNLGGARLTSITAWRDNSIDAGNDPDYSDAALVQEPANGNVTDFKQMSEELRLAGKAGRLDWLIGGFADKELMNNTSTILADDQFDLYLGATASAAAGVSPPNFLLLPELTGNLPGHTFIPGVSGQADSYQQTEKSYAFFTNETYTLIEHLDLTAGLRYTHESKDETANYNEPRRRFGLRSSCCMRSRRQLRFSKSVAVVGIRLRNAVQSGLQPGSRTISPSARTISTLRSNCPTTSRTTSWATPPGAMAPRPAASIWRG